MQGPLESDARLQKRDAVLTCVLQTHQKLDAFQDYLPELYLAGPRDSVPGLAPGAEPGLQLHDPLLAPTFVGVLDNIQVGD